MSLLSLWNAFDAATQLYGKLALEFAQRKPTITSAALFTVEDECFLEGVLSRTWQEWSLFCRQCVVASCLGTVDANGKAIAALPEAQSEGHVSSAAIQVKRGRKPVWGHTNSSLRDEPTWGDTDVLANIVASLNPSNRALLLAALSSAHDAAKTIQLIRNASAHNHAQNMADVMSRAASYVAFPITHPTQALFWTESSAGEFLVTHAVRVLSSTARLAIG